MSSPDTKTPYMAKDLLPLLSVYLVKRDFNLNNNTPEVIEIFVGVPDDIDSNWGMSLALESCGGVFLV